ncbi:ABC transporter [Salinisphaera sp. PC39]|uniref:ATP-binding cassette domain-containing protein n=1 Tax=Salinisphaera sp. PC39 TaxID=1304156 RepID=UPI0033402965
MLRIDRVTLRRGPQPLLHDVSLTVHAGQRVGVVGRNGTGKSSLFALLLGELAPDAGEVEVPAALTVAAVRQEAPSGDRPAVEYVLDGDSELRELETDIARAEAGDGDTGRLGALHERMLAIGGYAARARAARLMHGLGFAPATQEQPIDAFSGGWRMRLNLARALMCRAELLLLDEPTNHLDLDAVLWLQDYLAAYPGTLMVISHDRDFLDAVATHTLHLERRTATLYTGGYSAFEKLRAERAAHQQAEHEAQQKRLAEMQAFVDRFRAKATKARQAQSRLKQMERMTRTAPAHWDAPFSFRFLSPERLPTWLLRLDGAAVGHGDTPLVSGIKLTLAPGDRIALLGRNGAGKSTVMRLLAGELPALDGDMQRDRYLKVGYFAQHQLEQLDAAASPLTHLQRLDPRASEQSLRDFLGGFDFHGDRALEPVAPLSGGEKARLALALVVYRRPNLLLLDEPTNHLDLDMRHALERALQDYEGAMVLVAHDRHLIDATCDDLWRIADGRCKPFDGDLDDYAAWLRAQQANVEGEPDTATAGARPSARDQRREAAERRQRQKPLRDEIKRLEKELAALERKLTEVETALADPAVYERADDRVAELSREQGALRKRLDATEEAWLEAAERLETD